MRTPSSVNLPVRWSACEGLPRPLGAIVHPGAALGHRPVAQLHRCRRLMRSPIRAAHPAPFRFLHASTATSLTGSMRLLLQCPEIGYYIVNLFGAEVSDRPHFSRARRDGLLQLLIRFCLHFF